jgi:hypothetical protein
MIVIGAAGCAADSRRASGDPSQETLVRAEASIEAAEKSGGYERGGADLNLAKQKLTAARKASAEGDEDVAQRLAVEAQLDAEVAGATARNQEAQKAVGEVRESVRTLQDELRRNELRDLNRL